MLSVEVNETADSFLPSLLILRSLQNQPLQPVTGCWVYQTAVPSYIVKMN